MFTLQRYELYYILTKDYDNVIIDIIYLIGVYNYFYNPCTAYCASSTPKNNRVGVTTLTYFMR